MPIEAPLTFGQLSTWRSIETFAVDRLMEVNVFADWDLRGLETGAVLASLRRLAERHESLRTTYHVVDGRPVQRIHPEPVLRIERVDRADFEPADAGRLTRELAGRAFAVTGDPGWHATLATDGGRPLFLALSMSHMVVDVWAIRRLEAEFRALASDSGADCAPVPAPAPTPRDLASLQHGEAWKTRRQSAEKYWSRVLTGGPVRNLPDPPDRPTQRRIQATLTSSRLAGLAAEAAKMHSVSPQSVFTAAAAAALAQIVGRDRVMLSVMCSNRFDPQWQPLISTMNQLIPVVCDVDADAALVKHLKRVHLGALLAYRHGSYDVDRADELTRQTPAPDGSRFEHDCWFNYVAGAQVDPTSTTTNAAPPAHFAWTPPPRNAGHPFYFRVNEDDRGSVQVTLRVDPDIVPADQVVRALRMTVLSVLRAVSDPESTLGSLADEHAAPLPAGVFPADCEPEPTLVA